jgi:ribosomal protein S18 acetylase RimI-like enzyme
LDNPIAYGYFEKDSLKGFVEGFYEKWNRRFRISNIIIFDNDLRGKGIGKMLLDQIKIDAKKRGARIVVLETQSYNYKAISFYEKNGFEIIGFDLFAYSNSDIKNHNIRIEMGLRIDGYGKRLC